MIMTIEELQELFKEFEKMEDDPRAQEVALKHVEIVSDLFSEWSDHQLGFLLTDIVQLLRMERQRRDIILRIYSMVVEHDPSLLLNQSIQDYLHHRN